VWKGTEATEIEPVSYLEDDNQQHIHAKEFERAVDDFIKHAIRSDATLIEMQQQLHEQRRVPELAMRRKLEARMGYGPGEASAKIIDDLVNDQQLLGENAVQEVAAARPTLGGKVMRGREFESEARRNGYELGQDVPMTDNRAIFPNTALHLPFVPWQVGISAAIDLRQSERLGDGPITNARLSEMCGLINGALTKRTAVRGMAYTWERRYMAFRAKMTSGRRFEAARLLGDKMMIGHGDTLRPATKAHTARQKMQRAFAAEFLCPFGSLAQTLDGDLSTRSQKKAALFFKVSPRLVAMQLENNGLSSVQPA